jgi:hypothetical protein
MLSEAEILTSVHKSLIGFNKRAERTSTDLLVATFVDSAPHDEPGARYDVYKIDYGCYVDLINTAKMPEGLFEADETGAEQFVEVPKDDYRSIRRAILKLES